MGSHEISQVLCFLQGFDAFRADDTLCDVVLVPGDSGDTFPVHRVIMASCSDYFKAMFTGERSRFIRVVAGDKLISLCNRCVGKHYVWIV